jgi:hypothetical protein
VRVEGDPDSAQSFTCQACAIESIPVGQSRLVTDTWSDTSWRMWRQTDTTGYALTVRLDYRNRVASVSNHQLALTINQDAHRRVCKMPQPVPFGRGSSDSHADLIASIERFLKETRAA